MVKSLIIHCTHHKCGTLWFHSIYSDFCKRVNINYQFCKQIELKENTEFWFQHNGEVAFNKIKKPYICTHIIRDPRDILISSYFYHKWSEEPWCNVREKKFNNKTYQEILNSTDFEQGILFELNNFSKWNFSNLQKWNYKQSHFEMKYEDYINYNINNFNKLYSVLKLPMKHRETFLEIAYKNSFLIKTGRKIGEVKDYTHTRQGMPGVWRKYFNKWLTDLFKHRYGDLLIQLGYEKNNNW